MHKTTLDLIAKAAFLKIHPNALDGVIPHSPIISQNMLEFMAAGVIRDVAFKVKSEAVKAKLLDIGKAMAESSSKEMVQDWTDGGDICPPWRLPLPWPWSNVEGPQPDPWKGKLGPSPDPWRLGVTEQIVLADLILSLAGVTTNAGYSAQLRDTAATLIKDASQSAAAELERTKITPRFLKAPAQRLAS